MSQWHIALRYNLISAQIASLHYLHILVVYLLHSSTLWHRVLYCHQFLDMLSYAANHIIHSTWFSWKDFIFDNTTKEEVYWGWGLVIVVAIPLALVNLSTCWVVVHQETYALLWHSVEELRLVERCHHYHAVSVIVVTMSLSMLRYRLCVTVVWKKICPCTLLHERPAQTVNPSWFNCPSVAWGFFVE